MCVVRILLKRRVFQVFKPGKNFLRSAFFVGSGKREDEQNFKRRFFMILFVLRVFFPGAGRPLCNFLRELYCMGVAVLLDARTILVATRLRLLPFLAVLDGARTLSTILCTPPRIRWRQGLQPVLGVSWTLLLLLHDVGENNCNGHLLEFKNSVLAAESGYSLHRLNSLNSLICYPSMQAPSLTSEVCVESVGVVGVRELCHGDTGVSRLLGIARVDGLLHDVIRSVSARSNSLIRGHTECHGCSCGQIGSSLNSRVVRGPGLRGGTKGQVRQSAREKLAFAQHLSGRVHEGTWAGGNKRLNLRISQDKEIMAWCAVSGFSPRTPFVTPVLPGLGSDIRMKMGWKVLSKTRKSGVWFFRDAGRLVG